MHVYFTSKIRYLDSDYCTLLLKNCTYNLFCQQLMNKEKMHTYLYSFENGYVCVCVCVFICIYINKGRVYLGIKCSMLW